ncbi:hypothetical protein NDU88_005389 [Pleurodeles waltl]|uniref:Uncharacterized protein n=1 Tax=Pleurodeles waltl TaxID=8319 RepID=A0AAV7NQ90_PLEWA|nr:hypothetical protein NDU88_005389 [Pleurodeles waltl]
MKALESGLPAHDSAVQNLLISLSEEIRGKYEVSEYNQGKIRESWASLETKLNALTERISNLEMAVSEQEACVLSNSQGISQLTRNGKMVQETLESLENNLRRSSIRILNVPEGLDGEDIKALY